MFMEVKKHQNHPRRGLPIHDSVRHLTPKFHVESVHFGGELGVISAGGYGHHPATSATQGLRLLTETLCVVSLLLLLPEIAA